MYHIRSQPQYSTNLCGAVEDYGFFDLGNVIYINNNPKDERKICKKCAQRLVCEAKMCLRNSV